jgi:CheY-like chemotaxis protein
MIVLVVEDEPLINWEIVDHLSAAGHTVLSAPNADAAVVILESRNDIRVVFTDIDMPGSMDGLKLAAAVRDRWPPVEIIITSGKKRPDPAEIPERGLFIPKPYLPGHVAEMVAGFA